MIDDEQPRVHRSEIGDCPVEALNREEGFRPVLRVELLFKPEDPEADGIAHVCGRKFPADLMLVIKLLAHEMCNLSERDAPEPDDGHTKEDPRAEIPFMTSSSSAKICRANGWQVG